jgi:long-chain acyl-CoA synthetase
MVGYWQDPDATTAAVRNGWFHTGDLARCDVEGFYWFAGRKKEIIIRGGSNISPQEVEAVLYQHPAVGEVGVLKRRFMTNLLKKAWHAPAGARSAILST